jgi:hypothetical protein
MGNCWRYQFMEIKKIFSVGIDMMITEKNGTCLAKGKEDSSTISNP